MDKVTSSDGTAIAFDRYGAGSALILVGGAFQHRALDPQTAQLAGLLAQDLTVFHYDRRGRGDSGDTPPYAVEREVEDIAALVDEAGGRAHLFGMSSGGALGLVAAASGLPFAKMALYEPPFQVTNRRYPRGLTAWLEGLSHGERPPLGHRSDGDREGDQPGLPPLLLGRYHQVPWQREGMIRATHREPGH